MRVTGLKAKPLLPHYLGGFLGPFGTMVIVPMFPELRDEFNATNSDISWGLSAYLLPMAALLIVSGSAGERYGRQRVIRISAFVYAAASLFCAFAPTLGFFLLFRSFQGIANAFISPLLIAGIAEITPSAQLGRRMGIYGSFQAGGGALAPFVGGYAADIDWKLAFVITTVVASGIAFTVPASPVRNATQSLDLRALLSRRFVALSLTALTAAAGPIGAGVIVGIKARDNLGMEAETAGILLAAGNLGATILGTAFGKAIDAFGPRATGTLGLASVSCVVAGLGFTNSPLTMAPVYIVAGALYGLVVIVLQQLGASIVPANRGGALSAMLSFRFFGHAVGPLVWVPVLDRNQQTAFVGSAALGLVALAAFALATAEPRTDST